MPIFIYGTAETNYLAGRDPALGAAVARIGHISRKTMPDLFQALAESIVSQQISGRAAETVLSRLAAACGGDAITPDSVLALGADSVQSCGMTHKKAGWLTELARRVCSGELELASLAGLPDREVVRRLTELPGVGVWTAEMMLIFSLGRPDVLSRGDLGIRRGLMRLYGLDTLCKHDFEKYEEAYSPYRTVASLYLWHIAGE